MPLPPKKNLPPMPAGEKTQKAIEEWNQAKLRLKEQRTWKRSFGLGRIGKAIKQRFTWLEKHRIEPLADRLDTADVFRIIEKLSPVIEAIGVIAIPFAIWWMTESGQEAKEKAEKAARAQEAVKTYVNQLSTIFLDGNLEEDERLRAITRASTLALLNDPNLEGSHKGQVIAYLHELNLIDEPHPPNSQDTKPTEPIISLAKANFRSADLTDADLRGSDLTDADLIRADLKDADLIRATLRDADLTDADLRGATLRDADLTDANLTNADLTDADLLDADIRGANLTDANLTNADLLSADLRSANLRGADLRGADLRGTGIKSAKLCRTLLSPNINLDSNRDCKKLGLPVP
jgi:uncharacterized protein YjbI with pentapeptide repeats